MIAFSEEWEKEMMNLEKETIIKISSQIGKEFYNENKKLKLLIGVLCDGLIATSGFIDENKTTEYLAHLQDLLKKGSI